MDTHIQLVFVSGHGEWMKRDIYNLLVNYTYTVIGNEICPILQYYEIADRKIKLFQASPNSSDTKRKIKIKCPYFVILAPSNASNCSHNLPERTKCLFLWSPLPFIAVTLTQNGKNTMGY